MSSGSFFSHCNIFNWMWNHEFFRIYFTFTVQLFNLSTILTRKSPHKMHFFQFFPRLCSSILRFTSSHHQHYHLLFSDNEAAILLLYFDVILPFLFFPNFVKHRHSCHYQPYVLATVTWRCSCSLYEIQHLTVNWSTIVWKPNVWLLSGVLRFMPIQLKANSPKRLSVLFLFSLTFLFILLLFLFAEDHMAPLCINHSIT